MELGVHNHFVEEIDIFITLRKHSRETHVLFIITLREKLENPI